MNSIYASPPQAWSASCLPPIPTAWTMMSVQTQDIQSQPLLTVGQTLSVRTLLAPMTVFVWRVMNTSALWMDVWILMSVMTVFITIMLPSTAGHTLPVTTQRAGLICQIDTTAHAARDMNYSGSSGVRPYFLICPLTPSLTRLY